MAKFNTMNSNISEIKTEIKIRDEKYKDLYLTLTLENGKNINYIMHNDTRATVEEIKQYIDSKPVNNNLKISEFKERDYLFLDNKMGKTIQVTGKKIK